MNDAMKSTAPVLEVRDLVIEARGSDEPVVLVDGVSFSVFPDEVLALVGESGSGKSMTLLAVMDLLPEGVVVTSGEILFHGQDMAALTQRQLEDIRGRELAMVFQDPMTAMNPVRRIGTQIAEAVKLHARKLSSAAVTARVHELLGEVGIGNAATRARQYPHQWSGGMRQRAMIAMAMAHQPALLIADEPTTALDVTIQAQIMGMLAGIRRKGRQSMVLITHDLGLVAEVADRVLVMYSGRIVEASPVEPIFAGPAHPYTAGLLASVIPTEVAARAYAIPGNPPSPAARPRGCAFQSRCVVGRDRPECGEESPALLPVAVGHDAACYYPDEASAVLVLARSGSTERPGS